MYDNIKKRRGVSLEDGDGEDTCNTYLSDPETENGMFWCHDIR